MTKPRDARGECKFCRHSLFAPIMTTSYYIECGNMKSDHYGHLLNEIHGCKYWEKVTK